MRVLELPSDPHDRGVVHGELEDQLENILTSPVTGRRGIRSKAELLAFTHDYMEKARGFSEALWSEIEGISKGSGATVSEILFLNLHLEMIDLANGAAPGPIRPTDAGCTDIALQPDARQGCYLMQTYDVRLLRGGGVRLQV